MALFDDLERHVGCGHLDHGDLELGGLVADLVHHVGGLEAQQPVHLDVGAGLRNALFPDRIFDDLLPNAVRDDSRLTIFSSASSALPMVRMQ